MSFILTILLIIAIIFHKWIGKMLSVLLVPLVSDTLGAVFITFLIVVAVIAFLNFFSGMTQLNMHVPRVNLPKRKSRKQ